MGQVIKSAAPSGEVRVRGISLASSSPSASFAIEQPHEVALREARATIEQLGIRLSEREAEVRRLEEFAQQRYREGEAQGHSTGIKSAESREAERIRVITEEARRAADRFQAELAGLEQLAPVVAVRALEKVLDSPEEYTRLLTCVISKQLKRLEADAIIRVEVSAADFQEEDIERFSSDLGVPRTTIVVVPELGPGGCRIKLRLGHLDVGVPQQWAALRRALLEAADTEEQA